MRNVAVLLVVLRLALLQGSGQQPYVNQESQTLATVKLAPAVRKNIERVLFDFVHPEPKERRAIATQIPFDRVKLGPHNRWVWQAMAPNDLCGPHAKCEYWLFDPATGTSLVDDATGAELDVLDTRHNGWRDFMTSGNISYCEDVTMFYQFDGSRLRANRISEARCEVPVVLRPTHRDTTAMDGARRLFRLG